LAKLQFQGEGRGGAKLIGFDGQFFRKKILTRKKISFGLPLRFFVGSKILGERVYLA
jgi:hypothetical protein